MLGAGDSASRPGFQTFFLTLQPCGSRQSDDPNAAVSGWPCGQHPTQQAVSRRVGSETRMTQRTKPPFRADHVGSLLRTAPLKEARARHAKGAIDAAALKAIEDTEIEKIIKKQEEVGLKLATDGEFRRSWWHFDFFKGLKGVELIHHRDRHPVQGRRDQARSDQDHRQGRFRRPPAARAFQISQGALPRHAEDDDPCAEHVPLPARPRDGEQGGLPRL